MVLIKIAVSYLLQHERYMLVCSYQNIIVIGQINNILLFKRKRIVTNVAKFIFNAFKLRLDVWKIHSCITSIIIVVIATNMITRDERLCFHCQNCVLVNCPLYEEIRLTLFDQVRVLILTILMTDRANILGKSHLS